MLLMIDNYDSFTYILADYFKQKCDDKLEIYRNDKISLKLIENLAPKAIIISPGPGNPDQAGVTLDLIRNYHDKLPIFGVCLGHQALIQSFGGKIVQAPEPVHGKTDLINHNGRDIFKGIRNTINVTRYHSLVADKNAIPSDIEITATNQDGLVMAFSHVKYPLYGVQFHPESITTEYGMQMIENFLNIIK